MIASALRSLALLAAVASLGMLAIASSALFAMWAQTIAALWRSLF